MHSRSLTSPSCLAPFRVATLLRGAVVLGFFAALSGCAVWNSVFDSGSGTDRATDPAAPPSASASATSVQSAAAPEPAAVPATSAPAAPMPPETTPAQATPVHTPTATALPEPAAQTTPPSVPMSSVAMPAAAPSATQRAPVKGAPTSAGYYINVGLFAVAANASRATAQLSAAGQPVFSEAVHSKKGALTRVRVGPFHTRADADAAAKKIKAQGLDAVVFKRR